MNRLIFLFVLLPSVLFAQKNNFQTIRGSIIDKQSHITLVGVTIQINSLNIGTSSDASGNYILSDIPPNRYEVTVRFMGYKSQIIPNVIVTSGKEVVLDIAMEEEFQQLKEVAVTATTKSSVINKLSSVSARTFSMEEVNRYAGGRSDPARLVSNFAGVSVADDSRNDIVIRGNSPVGVLWRIDEMTVTNPNHFAAVGTTGGAVSALNTNLLRSSDFFTSAFPSEYGNAVAGVFDLGFRNGNNKKRETTIQSGVITGLEVTTEGPFSKKSDASYLIGYRYSLAGFAQGLGIDIGTTATPTYQDLSFKINSAASKLGKFSLFGILASSTINIGGGSQQTLYANGNKVDFSSKIGIVGMNHFKQINSRSFISSTIGVNYSSTIQTAYDFDRMFDSTFVKEENNVAKTSCFLSINYNLKVNSRLFFKAGLQDEIIGVDLFYKTKQMVFDPFKQVWDFNSNTNLLQGYAHLKYNITEKFVINAGVHAQYFYLNNSKTVEPRFGLIYYSSNKSSINVGFGFHSQMQPINMYYLQTENINGNYVYNNINLEFTKSQHFVIGYNIQPLNDWRIKTEVYYQKLYNVPVSNYPSSYSMLNTGSTFKSDLSDSLINDGTGFNQGVELNIEKFFSKGYYGLFTVSFYDSKYVGSDGVERNTAFNGNYVANALAGKEWKTGSEKQNRFALDLKYTIAGGRAYTPIDLSASIASGHEVLSSDVYSANYDRYSRLDLKFGYTINSKSRKFAQTLSLDLQNMTKHKNVFSQNYDNKSQSIENTYQLGFFPNLVYKIQF
jgi:hypothetical protein